MQYLLCEMSFMQAGVQALLCSPLQMYLIVQINGSDSNDVQCTKHSKTVVYVCIYLHVRVGPTNPNRVHHRVPEVTVRSRCATS